MAQPLTTHRGHPSMVSGTVWIANRWPQIFRTACCSAWLILASCATQENSVQPRTGLDRAELELSEARSAAQPLETRITRYLEAAELCENEITKSAPGPTQSRAARIYDDASAEVTILLRQAAGGKYWNRDEQLHDGAITYRIRFNPGIAYGVWSPSLFSDFQSADRIRPLGLEVERTGLGGTLVGTQKPDPGKEPFAPPVGYQCAVTATLDFSRPLQVSETHPVELTLYNPVVTSSGQFDHLNRPLAYDLTAPLAAYPRKSAGMVALRGLLLPDTVPHREGLYLLEPYDPRRIPLVFVHGLVSVPQMWLNIANEIRVDPELRRHYQFWVFYYPTANPIVLSGASLRQDLATAEQLYRPSHGIILVGHSMGGIVSRMQATDTGRVLWDSVFGQQADKVYRESPPDSEAKKALIFKADPDIKRIVFICVPHRGSYLASNFIGSLGITLIRVPGRAIRAVENSFSSPLSTLTGIKNLRVPTSIHGLSPHSPVLAGLDKLPIQARYHSIIGDRGRGDSPNSSDGVVPYWSSHLAGAESEKIIPTGHGGYRSPESIEELKRILHTHLAESGAGSGDAIPRK
jgi:pimeloyl-ACP methyl ester carboxylesterase